MYDFPTQVRFQSRRGRPIIRKSVPECFLTKKTLEVDFPIISKSFAPDGNDEDEEVEDKKLDPNA